MDRLIDAKEAARLLGISYGSLQRMVRNGQLKVIWVGSRRGVMRFRPESIEEFVKERER